MKNLWVIVPLIAALLAASCGRKNMRADAMHCTMHAVHNCYNRSDVAQCIGISENAIDEYYLFTESSPSGVDIVSTESALQSQVGNKIVEEVMQRIQMIYSDKQFQQWNFSELSMPVIFRTFAQKGKNPSMMVVGFVKKEDFTPKAIIHYLPLEYKMDIIGREKDITNKGW